MRIYLSNSTLMINIIIATAASIQVMEAIIYKVQRGCIHCEVDGEKSVVTGDGRTLTF